MTVMQGKVHKYLRMTIDYSSPDKLISLMINYIGNMIDDITEYTKGESASPDAHHLFGIAEYTTKLSQTDTYLFHHFVAQLIYPSKNSCTDIQISVYVLCTRASGQDTDDYNNMERVVKSIQGNFFLPLILSIKKSRSIKWYVDAGFSVHKYTKINTGGFMPMVKGGSYVQSIKQNLSTKI